MHFQERSAADYPKCSRIDRSCIKFQSNCVEISYSNLLKIPVATLNVHPSGPPALCPAPDPPALLNQAPPSFPPLSLYPPNRSSRPAAEAPKPMESRGGGCGPTTDPDRSNLCVCARSYVRAHVRARARTRMCTNTCVHACANTCVAHTCVRDRVMVPARTRGRALEKCDTLRFLPLHGHGG